MCEEKWLIDAIIEIDMEIRRNLKSLERLAEKNDLVLEYVLETYKDKMVNKINKILKGTP